MTAQPPGEPGVSRELPLAKQMVTSLPGSIRAFQQEAKECSFFCGSSPGPKGIFEGGPSRNWTHPPVSLSCAGDDVRVRIRKCLGMLGVGHNCGPLLRWAGEQAEEIVRPPVRGAWKVDGGRATSSLKDILDRHPPGSKRNRWQLGRWQWSEASRRSSPELSPIPIPHSPWA